MIIYFTLGLLTVLLCIIINVIEEGWGVLNKFIHFYVLVNLTVVILLWPIILPGVVIEYLKERK